MPDSRQATAARADQPGTPPPPQKNEPDPLIGRTINGRFKIVSVIARGGMGKVYKAEQAPLGRICALKVLSPKYDGDKDPEFHKRFFLEASTSAKLSHANTITVFDYGQDGDLYFIAMEFVDGRTLHRTLRDEGPLVEQRIIHIASQICRSLREAHNIGVVHRDLKPGNILLSDRGDERDNVKVLDFGLVKDVTGEAEDLTQAGLFMGSPKYMAPEQILGGEISPRTDIYSLGVMMYEMLTGKVPFDRGASVGTLMAHVNDPPPPIREVNPKVQLTVAFEGIVYKCLEKDPAKRFVSMKDLLNALKRVGNEDGTLTDTHESMPMARLDSGAPAPMSSGSGSGSGPILKQGNLANAKDARFASPSISEMLSPGPAPPADTDMSARPQQKGAKAYILGLGAAVAAAIVAVVMLTSKRPPEGAQGAGTTTTATPTTTAQAESNPTTQTTTVAPPATPANNNGPTIHKLRVESDPPGASVSENGTEKCTSTPCELVYKDDEAKAEHKLSISKKGYKTAKITAAPTEEKVNAKLDANVVINAPAPRSPAPGTTGRKPNPYGD